MNEEFENFKNWQNGLWLFFKWFVILLFRPIKDLLILIKDEIIKNFKKREWKSLWLAILPIVLILFFYIYSFNWIYKDLHKWFHSERYEKILIDNYVNDIENFLKKYEERFLAHDCKFMQEVWSDEAMYDKYWKISYNENYRCEAFYKIQEIKMLPLKIWNIKKSWNKLKVRWELIRVEKINWKPIKIAPIRFELWKTIDMDLWHFNLYWEANDRWIDSEFKENYN